MNEDLATQAFIDSCAIVNNQEYIPAETARNVLGLNATHDEQFIMHYQIKNKFGAIDTTVLIFELEDVMLPGGEATPTARLVMRLEPTHYGSQIFKKEYVKK